MKATVQAMAVFRHSVLADMFLGPGTRLTIRVNALEDKDTIIVGKVLSWLDRCATSPREQMKRIDYGNGLGR